MKWLKKQKAPRLLASWQFGTLEDAVDRAKMDWQNACHLVDQSEQDADVEDAIYYLQLTEKRYMYLLNQAKRGQIC